MPLDLGQLFVSAVIAAVVGGIVAELRGRAAEGRAANREAQRDRLVLQRQEWLRQIDDTEQDLAATLDWHIARSAGVEAAMREATARRAAASHAQIYLVGDEELLRRWMDLMDELERLEPGAKTLSESHAARMGALRG